MNKLKVNEIFYSLQGEGANTGMPVIFIRLSGCNLKCSYCDTDHSSYTEMDIDEICNQLQKYSLCKKVIFTGGEPLLQLTPKQVDILQFLNYSVAVETNGTLPLYKGEVNFDFDYVSVSPKINAQAICQNFLNNEVNEFRYAISAGETPPEIQDLPIADAYFISPICDGDEIIQENVNWCIQFCLSHPRWQLSVQSHKLWKIK